MKILKIVLKVIGSIALFAVVFTASFVGSIVYTVSAPGKLLKVEWNEQFGTIYSNLPYVNDYGNCFDLYTPAGLNGEKDHALVLYIHGGGFTSGTKDGGEKWCKFLAAKGYITASVDYTVYNEQHVSDLNRMNREISDCVEAIYEKCQELGYNVTQMATTGESAGGCLAMLYAYSQEESAPIPVKFVFQQTGPAHFSPEGWEDGDEEASAGFLSMMTGKSITAEMVKSGAAEADMIAISPAFPSV